MINLYAERELGSVLSVGNSRMLLLWSEMWDTALISYACCYGCITYHLETQWLDTMAIILFFLFLSLSSFSFPLSPFSFFSGWPGIQNGHNGDISGLEHYNLSHKSSEKGLYFVEILQFYFNPTVTWFSQLKKKCKHYFICRGKMVFSFEWCVSS